MSLQDIRQKLADSPDLRFYVLLVITALCAALYYVSTIKVCYDHYALGSTDKICVDWAHREWWSAMSLKATALLGLPIIAGAVIGFATFSLRIWLLATLGLILLAIGLNFVPLGR
jgi:hypothetical protein